VYFVAKTHYAFLESSNPKRRGSDIYPGHATAKTKRDAEDTDSTTRTGPVVVDCLRLMIYDCFAHETLDLTSEIQIKATTTSPLRREEWLQKSGQRGEVACLNQYLARAAELRNDSLTADHAAKESRGGFSQSVLRSSFPRDQMTCVYYVTFASTQNLSVDRAKRGDQQ
jgi:hypothetical protein